MNKSKLELLNKYFDAIKSSELKSLGLMLGSAKAGTKKELRTALNEQMGNLNTLWRLRESPTGLRVMGIDLGISNFAFTTFHWGKGMKRPVLKDMYKVQLAGDFVHLNEGEISPPLRPEVMAMLGMNLANWLVKFDSNAYLIERQRSRSVSSSSILENILKVMILEYVLYSNLQNKIIRESLPVHLFPSLPKRMVDFTCSGLPIEQLLAGTKSGSNQKSKALGSNLLSKKLRIALCRSLVFDQISGKQRRFFMFDLDPQFMERCLAYPGDKTAINFYEISKGTSIDMDFKQRNKNDDLCDSLLHGLVWMRWLSNYDTLLAFASKHPIPDTDSQNQFKQLIEDFNESHNKFLLTVITHI